MQVEKRELIKPRKLEIEKCVLEISVRILRLKWFPMAAVTNLASQKHTSLLPHNV